MTPDLDALERAALAATPGPWYQSGSPWFSTGSLVLAGSPDRHAGHIIVDTDPMDCREDVPEGELGDPNDDAAYIAAASPSVVLALVREVRELRQRVSDLANGEDPIGDAKDTAALKRLDAENTRLRAALAQSDRPCAYCTLPADEWSKCAQGFPGCDRADDAMGCPHLGATVERDRLRKALEDVGTRLIQVRDERTGRQTWIPSGSQSLVGIHDIVERALSPEPRGGAA